MPSRRKRNASQSRETDTPQTQRGNSTSSRRRGTVDTEQSNQSSSSSSSHRRSSSRVGRAEGTVSSGIDLTGDPDINSSKQTSLRSPLVLHDDDEVVVDTHDNDEIDLSGPTMSSPQPPTEGEDDSDVRTGMMDIDDNDGNSTTEGSTNNDDSTPTVAASLRECPVCFEEFENAIFQCRNGHLLCEECYHRVSYCCPQCKISMDRTGIRNRALENMLGIDIRVRHKCIWRLFGCDFIWTEPRKSKTTHTNAAGVSSDDARSSSSSAASSASATSSSSKDHSHPCFTKGGRVGALIAAMNPFHQHCSVCQYRPHLCPFPNCLWVNSFHKYESHCASNHSTSLNSVSLPVGPLLTSYQTYSGLVTRAGRVKPTRMTDHSSMKKNSRLAITRDQRSQMTGQEPVMIPASTEVDSSSTSTLVSSNATNNFEEMEQRKIDDDRARNVYEFAHAIKLPKRAVRLIMDAYQVSMLECLRENGTMRSDGGIQSLDRVWYDSSELDELRAKSDYLWSEIKGHHRSRGGGSLNNHSSNGMSGSNNSHTTNAQSKLGKSMSDLMWPKIYRFNSGIHFFVLTRLIRGRLYVSVRLNHLKPISSKRQIDEMNGLIYGEKRAVFEQFARNDGFMKDEGRIIKHGGFSRLPSEMRDLLLRLSCAVNPFRADYPFSMARHSSINAGGIHHNSSSDDELSAISRRSSMASIWNVARMVSMSGPSYTPSIGSSSASASASSSAAAAASSASHIPPCLVHSRMRAPSSFCSAGEVTVQLLKKNPMYPDNGMLSVVASDSNELHLADVPLGFDRKCGLCFSIPSLKFAQCWQLRDDHGRSLDRKDGGERPLVDGDGALSAAHSAIVRFHFVVRLFDSSKTGVISTLTDIGLHHSKLEKTKKRKVVHNADYIQID